MSGFSTSVTTATTSGSANNSPFPPGYTGAAVGAVAALSNPAGVAVGSLSVSSYFGATIAAIGYDAASPNQTQFMVALEGSYDQAFLGSVTFTDAVGAQTYNPAVATYIQQLVGAQEITLWVWPATGYFVSGTAYTVSIANTGDVPVTLAGIAPSSTEIILSWNDSLVGLPQHYEIWRAVGSSTVSEFVDDIAPATMPMSYSDTALAASTQYTYQIRAIVTSDESEYYLSNTEVLFTPASGISASFNCNCEAVPAIPTNQTLGTLRNRLAVRLGYAAQASNLPPGAKLLFNEWLTSAQNQIYRFFNEKRIERFYAWQMQLNQRYYGLNQDESGCRAIDSLGIKWVGFEDLNKAWYPLIEGIDPVMYTRAQISTGWPTHYEIRSCIEIFPAPKAAYTLWVKGPFVLDPFAADTDYPTVDSELVLMLAIGLGKTHYGQPDANACMTQANNYMMKIVAAAHRTARYVPRTRQNTLLTPPLFIPTLTE
jgi:hypothetical protein